MAALAGKPGTWVQEDPPLVLLNNFGGAMSSGDTVEANIRLGSKEETPSARIVEWLSSGVLCSARQHFKGLAFV